MYTMSSVAIKFHAIDIYKYLYGLPEAGNETDFAASLTDSAQPKCCL